MIYRLEEWRALWTGGTAQRANVKETRQRLLTSHISALHCKLQSLDDTSHLLSFIPQSQQPTTLICQRVWSRNDFRHLTKTIHFQRATVRCHCACHSNSVSVNCAFEISVRRRHHHQCLSYIFILMQCNTDQKFFQIFVVGYDAVVNNNKLCSTITQTFTDTENLVTSLQTTTF